MLAYSLGDSNPWAGGPVAFGLVERLYITLRNKWQSRAAHLVTMGSQERHEELGPCPLLGHCPVI